MKKGYFILITCALVLASFPVVASAGCGCQSGVVFDISTPVVPPTLQGMFVGGTSSCTNSQLCIQKIGSTTSQPMPCLGTNCQGKQLNKFGKSSLLGKLGRN